MLHVKRLTVSLSAVLLCLSSASSARAQPLRPEAADAVARMEAAAGIDLAVTSSRQTGLAVFVSTGGGGGGIPLTASASASVQERALDFVDSYGQAFGIGGRQQVQVTRTSPVDEAGMEHVRLRQLYQGIPVTAGELIVHLRGKEVMAANGETLADFSDVGTNPGLLPAQAVDLARELLEKHLGDTAGLTLSTPRLEILNRGLLEEGSFPSHLSWFIEARRIDVREYMWIDAGTGTFLLQFSQLPHARSRSVYSTFNSSSLPGTLIRSEGQGPSGNTDVDRAYDYSGDTYDYYFSVHGRDSYDGAGGVLVSTVDFCPNPGDCPYANAFWNGVQMVYGDGFPAADDVDAHELTHAVTEYTAGLFYYMQSGALNESFSDIFGETVDLTNGAGTDTAPVRWKMGEDIPGFGVIRDMRDPTLFGDPGKSSDSQFVCDDPGGDAGGVHSNSGVPNHAYSLMVDGGTYNGLNVTGIGLTKAGKIEYRVLSQYLTSGSGFLDAYLSLSQACFDLVGVSGITVADCSQVRSAIDAVELWYYWRCEVNQQWQFSPCIDDPVGQVLFQDDLEAGGGNWLVSTGGGSVPAWFLGNFFATSGTQHLYGQSLSSINDSGVYMSSSVNLPANSFLYFKHSFGFENFGNFYYDGGVLEVSTNGGSTWSDAGSLVDNGAFYGGTISNCCGNPLSGRSGFVADSHGYTATRLDLSSLTGQSVRFRWRFASDVSVNDYGWFIDDVLIHTCLNAIFLDGFESGNTTAWSITVP